MGKLDAGQIEEYFAVHLPYRMRILLAHYKMTGPNGWRGNPAWLDACFVASLVTGRLFLNVLGVGKKGGVLDCFAPQPDDVTVEDLGGKLLDPAALPTADRDLFLGFLTMADKAAAHFTLPMNHDWTKTHDVIRRIHHYLNVNLYDQAGRTGLEPLT
jgi:hypothetical protein